MTTTAPKSPNSPFNKNYQHAQKREAILSEAANLFNNQGTRATTLTDIADSLNLAKTTLYYYVKSKEELVYQCYIDSCDKLGLMLDEAERFPGKGKDKLTVFIRAYFSNRKAVAMGLQPHDAILTEIRALKVVHRDEIAALYSALFKRIKTIVQIGVADGSMVGSNAIDSALAIFGLVQLTVLWLPKIETENIDQTAGSFIDLVFNGIAINDEFIPGDFVGILDEPADAGRQVPTIRKQEAFYKTGSAFFNRKGFKSTSLDEIAEALDVTKGTFYYHIKDKEELLYHCFQRSLSILNNMQELAEKNAGTGLETLRFCSYYLFQIQNSDKGPLIRFNLIPSLSEELKQNVMDGISAISERFGNMIKKGIKDGSIRNIDPFIAEQLFTTAIDISAELQWMRPIEDIPGAYQSFFSFYFTGLAHEQD